MKTSLLLLLALSSLVSLISVSSSKAQSTNYYYNNFDNNSIGSGIIKTSAGDESLQVSNVNPLVGSHSMASTGLGNAATYKFSFIPSGTSLNNTQANNNGWEWTMIYRNNGGNTGDPTTIDNNENAWRYWLYANNTDVTNLQGYYLSQVGSSLNIYMRVNGNDTRLILSYDLTNIGGNNTTYAIRVQRINVNGYTFRLFVDPYNAATTQATTLRAELLNSGDNNMFNTYNYSGLQLASNSVGRFKFDELKMYARKIQIIGANGTENGISSPLYDGQKDAVIYGLKFKTRGLFADVYRVAFEIEQTGYYSFADILENARLFRSVNDYFGDADDVLINQSKWGGAFTPTIGYRVLEASDFKAQTFASLGSSDGSLIEVGSLFFKVDVKGDASTRGTFTIKSPNYIGDNSANLNYTTQGDVVTGANPTPPTTSVKVFDWVGTTPVWSAASNWRYPNNTEPSTAPGPNDLVRIGVNKTFSKEPIINASTTIGNLIIAGTTASLPSIKINGTNTLTVSGSFTNQTASAILGSGSLTVQGNWTTSGGKIDLTTESVTVKFTGSNAQAITDQGSDAGNGVMFGNVEFSGGGTKTLGGSGKFAVAIGKFLTMGPSTILDAAGKLTLKAGVSGTASVGVIPANSSIRGQVTVEKYVQGGSKDMWRTYRMWSSPVYDNTANFTNANTVSNRTYNFTQFIDDVIITGTGGAANGFDVNLTNNASAWTYNNGFIAIPNINTSINIGRGAYLYYRGNRNNYEQKINAPYIDAESMIITFKGTLNQQSVTVPLVHGSTGFSMLGNPYAATIDWNAVTKSANIDKVMRMWNPAFRQYATFNGEFGVNGGSNYIGPGQAFFVTTKDNASPYVTFNENSKVTVASAPQTPVYNVVMNVGEKRLSSNNAVMAVNGGVKQLASTKIRVKLLKPNAENADETLIVLRENEKSDYADSDVPRTGGETVFLSSLSTDAKELAINYMPEISAVSSIPLSVNASSNGNYLLEIELTDLPLGYSVQLKDKYLGSLTGLVANGNSYSLTIDKAKATSFGANRFELLIAPPTSLPVVFKEFKGSAVNEGVRLSWSTSSETDNKYFEVFRAGEEQVYTSIGTVPANQKGAYSLLDKTPLKGNNYYKLTQVDKNGKSSEFTDLVVVKYDLNGNTPGDIAVYPTLVQSTFTVKYNGSANATSYLLRVSDVTGKEIYKKGVDKNDLINGVAGDLSVAPKGAYFVAVFDSVNGNKIGTAKIIKK
ncbi:hypothetical protein [Pedobacter sp. SL55]|uniref:hypothetical protein n=1 Tax=Pedobacter sp. SL55 TaxID=2995161 RepID=UPI0022707DE3|nr:hypothetical protein [Pedobacter sp. SL55]WAC42304.1 hypothetical protein OVA16_08100 [Pedobacter sp. SL55]